MVQKEVNYKNKKRYNTARYPIRQPRFITWLLHLVCKIGLMGKEYKIEKINVDDLKPPYLMLSNHLYFIDFQLSAVANYPHRTNNVANIDGFIKRAWLMNLLGCICTRKFSNDLHLIKSVVKVLKRGDVASIYPEARYSATGFTSFIPDSIGKLAKMCKVPVVVVIHHGNHLYTPFYDFRKVRKVPLHTTMTKILTAEEVAILSVDEINDRIKKAFEYDEYQYQKDNHILIKEPYRAEGLHKILYQCPHCLKEGKMYSKGAEIFCEECGKVWTWQEDGYLKANEGETEFDHIPNWYKWQIKNVKEEVESGKYHFEDDVEVYTLPNTNKIHYLGKAKVSHDAINGYILQGHYRNEDYCMIRKPLAANSIQVEYDHVHIKPYDCFVINTEDDTYFIYPSKKNVITKLAIATEEIYKFNLTTKK